MCVCKDRAVSGEKLVTERQMPDHLRSVLPVNVDGSAALHTLLDVAIGGLEEKPVNLLQLASACVLRKCNWHQRRGHHHVTFPAHRG